MKMNNNEKLIKFLQEKSKWLRIETLKMHKIAKRMRIASCLSAVEIFVVLYYSGIFDFVSKKDRLIISKAHGALSMYPILAEFGYFSKEQLTMISQNNSLLGLIPDCSIPGFDIVIGSLGHGLGIGCGISIALKKKNIKSTVVVVCGDGELFEGSVWEAIMFAGHHKINNLLLIVDRNQKCMLDYCNKVIDLEPLNKKFEVFNWNVSTVSNGHDVRELYTVLKKFKDEKQNRPKVIIVNTIKGKGVPKLESDPQAHIRMLTEKEIDEVIENLK